MAFFQRMTLRQSFLLYQTHPFHRGIPYELKRQMSLLGAFHFSSPKEPPPSSSTTVVRRENPIVVRWICRSPCRQVGLQSAVDSATSLPTVDIGMIHPVSKPMSFLILGLDGPVAHDFGYITVGSSFGTLSPWTRGGWPPSQRQTPRNVD
jgi:hypothetical protein